MIYSSKLCSLNLLCSKVEYLHPPDIDIQVSEHHPGVDADHPDVVTLGVQHVAQVPGAHDLSCLGVTIALFRRVECVEVEVIPVHPGPHVVSTAGHVYYPAGLSLVVRGRLGEGGQEQVGEQEVSEIVGSKLRFISILCFPPEIFQLKEKYFNSTPTILM